MRSTVFILGRYLLVLAVAAIGTARPAPERSLEFRATPASVLRIQGGSTLGIWEAEARTMDAIIMPGPVLERMSAHIRQILEWPAAVRKGYDTVLPSTIDPGDQPRAELIIPVERLTARKPGMRDDLLRALRAREHPAIRFVLRKADGFSVAPGGEGVLGSYHLTAVGDLSLAGETRPIAVHAAIDQIGPFTFRVTARQKVRMSDFGIEPPSALFGLVRAEDEIVVSFDLTFEAKEAPSIEKCGN